MAKSLTPTFPSSPDASCRFFLDVRPDGFTLLAQARAGEMLGTEVAEHLSQTGGRTAPLPDDLGLSERDRQLLDGTLERVEQFLARFQERCHAALPSAVAALREENHRLRSALENCVAACASLVERTAESACEGCEADHASAWLALEEARQALRPGLPALP